MRTIFPGNSEMAGRMRDLDWTLTSLGPPDQWPEPLKHSINLCLTSRFPIVIYWGPQLAMFYNDPCIPLFGHAKHPSYLGRPGQEAWSDIWDTVGPMCEGVMRTGEATWSKDVLLFFERHLSREEVYATFSIGPILLESGAVGGLFCPCTEVTEKVVGARRLETLRRLGVQSLEADTVDAACEEAAKVLAENPYDIPFAAIYLINDAGTHAVLKSLAGFSSQAPLFPQSISLTQDDVSPWPFVSVFRSRRSEETNNLIEAGLQLPGGPWPESSSKAIVLPILGAHYESVAGFAAFGVGPRRVLDEAYRTFFDLIAGQIGVAISNARALRKTHESVQMILESITDMFFAVDREWRYTHFNKHAEELLKAMGKDSSTIIGKKLWDEFPGLQFEQAVRRAMSERVEVTYENYSPLLGEWVENRIYPSPDGGLAMFLRYVTDRKRGEEALQKLQAELAHVTRMTTMGELAASIAHEINQPLGAIVNNSSVARRLIGTPGAEEEMRAVLSDIINDANRSSSIVARMRALTKRSTPEKSPLHLKDVVADVLALAQHDLAEHRITVSSELAADLPQVSGDRVQLQQLLLNLVLNGIEAMNSVDDSRRILTIRGRRSRLNEQPAVLITVHDLGSGFRREDSERLFDPFYTTKPQGMGIGLRVCRSIIEAHGGRLWATPNNGMGATFWCALPVESRSE